METDLALLDDRYVIKTHIGSGTYSEVYQGYDMLEGDSKQVAIKFIKDNNNSL